MAKIQRENVIEMFILLECAKHVLNNRKVDTIDTQSKLIEKVKWKYWMNLMNTKIYKYSTRFKLSR